ncbi:MAG TPA: hypothetical protein DD734_00660, partial [Firmicutes bacterium]|nr:hypothetical protein [Bacillota bacterium]
TFRHKYAGQIAAKIQVVRRALQTVGQDGQEMSSFRREFQQRMSQAGAHVRFPALVKTAVQEGEQQYRRILNYEVKLNNAAEILDFFRNRQLCLTHLAVLKSIAAYLERGGGSRGS